MQGEVMTIDGCGRKYVDTTETEQQRELNRHSMLKTRLLPGAFYKGLVLLLYILEWCCLLGGSANYYLVSIVHWKQDQLVSTSTKLFNCCPWNKVEKAVVRRSSLTINHLACLDYWTSIKAMPTNLLVILELRQKSESDFYCATYFTAKQVAGLPYEQLTMNATIMKM